MPTSGFVLVRLCARGQGRADADIRFESGLNVVSGASDTGKSYIFECIRYMLGGKNPPDSVPEDNGYDTLFLELRALTGDPVTLQRSLKQGGDFRVFRCPLAEITDSTEFEELRWQVRKGRSDSLPDHLMSICGLTGRVVRKNKQGVTRPLHFSDIRNFSMINETTIIEKRTPVWPSGQFANKTVDHSVFSFILSGEDASSVVTAPDVKIAKAEWRAKDELLNEMISELESELAGCPDNIQQELDAIEAAIEESAVNIRERSAEIETLLAQRREFWRDIQPARSRMGVIEQLRERFRLLTEHYQSDLERLEFVSESDFYLSQLGAGHCPVCGTLLEEHTAEQLAADRETGASIQQASKCEAAKVETQLKDLANTMSRLVAERQELQSSVDELQAKIAEVNDAISQNLEPTIATAQGELQQLFQQRENLTAIQNKRQRLAMLRAQLDDLGEEPKKTKKGDVTIPASVTMSKARRRFCDGLEERLREWRFPDVGTVEFDTEFDVVINGQGRATHGKGIRAVIHAAFSMSLMARFKERHSHLVVLDSPLTSFKERDSYEASDDMQRAFYENLVKTPGDEQIIILENKDPPNDLQGQMTYHHFSGVDGEGRQGFYPREVRPTK